MGTGKTVVAKKLAKKLGMEYVSTDDLIEKKEGRLIKDIFAKDGEAYFREIENKVVQEVSSKNSQVIDSGGGVILHQENTDALKINGVIVCLGAKPETILRRTKGHKHRPLLNVPDPRSKIEKLLKSRAPFYAKADFSIDTSNRTIEEVVTQISGLVTKG